MVKITLKLAWGSWKLILHKKMAQHNVGADLSKSGGGFVGDGELGCFSDSQVINNLLGIYNLEQSIFKMKYSN